MTVICYLNPESQVNLAPVVGSQNERKVHTLTGLPVLCDGEGNYVVLNVDIYERPDYPLRSDLMPEIGWYSAKILVDQASYTTRKIATGNYLCDDPEVTIVLKKGLIDVGGVKHQPMLVRAPTWEKLRAAIEGIRQGKITPHGRPFTLLETTQLELTEAELDVRKLNQDLEGRSGALAIERGRTYDLLGAVHGAWKHLAGQSSDLVYLHHQDPNTAVDFQHLREQLIRARRNSEELAGIKATFCYRLLSWLKLLP